MANKVPKEQKSTFYAKELEAARLRGDWDEDVAVTGGARLPWTELLRKYVKHNPNEKAAPTIASLEQRVRSTLSAFYKDEDFGDRSFDHDDAFPDGTGKTTFAPSIPLDRTGNGWSGEAFGEDTRQLTSMRESTREPLVKQTIAALEAFAHLAAGQDENAVELLHEVRFLEDVDLQGLKAGKHGDEYTIALIMLGFTVYGMANERLFAKRGDRGYLPFAYAGFACSIDLHETVRGGKSANALRGLLADEIERWGEMSLYRNALLSVRYGNTTLALNALRAYQSHAGRWPANFREQQRLVIYRTYLRTLNQSFVAGQYTSPPTNIVPSKDDCRSAAYQTSVVAACASRALIRDFESERASRHVQSNAKTSVATSTAKGGRGPRTTSTRRPDEYRDLRVNGSTVWSNEFLTVQKVASEGISRSSNFPKAGHVNLAALELSDEILQGWKLSGERGGDWADEIVEFLYLLSRVTFLSQRISRHLFTLLVASENYAEAERALKLYIQIVDKAREGDAAEAGGLVEESRRREEGHEGPAEGQGALTDASKKEAEKLHLDSDSDKLYINTLLYGVHMYLKYTHDDQAADKLAKKVVAFVDSDAGKIIAKDITLWAKVKRLAGVARASLCVQESNPVKRAKLQDEALALLKQSATLDDQSSETFYALAYLQSEMLDVGNAIRNARRALELEPAQIEYWHLLTLLVSSRKDFKGALRLAEEALAEAEDDDEADRAAPKTGMSNGVVNGSTMAESGASRLVLLSVDYPPRGSERAESIVRLMMTHNALEEIVEGGQAAMEGQREIFELFHRRIGTSLPMQGQRHSLGVNAVNGNDKNTSGGHAANGSQTTTVLGGAHQPHSRFHSLTGLGQSGSHHHLLPVHPTTKKNHLDTSLPRNTSVSAPLTLEGKYDKPEGQAITSAQIRNVLHIKRQTSLLVSLWLMSAATFRRNDRLSECRTAIQEAERADPSDPDVWLQLALWFEQQNGHDVDQSSSRLAIQCLYKALACKSDHIGATVHLARLFLTHPSNSSIRDVQDAIAEVASPLPQTSDNNHPSPLASELVSQTQSRRITASTPANSNVDEKKGNTQDDSSVSAGDSKLAKERRILAAVSLAEGLLLHLTQSNGWNVSEAWLFLARVMKETNRREKERECLEYALELEKAKTVRALAIAVQRS